MHLHEHSTSAITPRVACIVLNWNGGADTISCLAALARISYPQMRVIVVDNGSTDDSVEKIREAFPDVAVLASGKNLGFAKGNNLGIRFALEEGADYIWLLNNDTEPTVDALSQLVDIAESSGDVGAVGSILMYASRPDDVQVWGGGRVNRWTGHSSYAIAPKPTSWFHFLCGASMLVRCSVFNAIGYLDEEFFLYWEDVEFGVRLTTKGWKLAIAPDSIVLHKVNASTRRANMSGERYSTTSGIRFLRKYSPLSWVSICIFLVGRCAKRVALGQPKRVVSVYHGICDYIVSVRTQASA